MNYLAQQAEKRLIELEEEIKWCGDTMLDKAIESGEWLSKVKADTAHGGFEKWIEEKLPISASTARNRMRLFTHRKTLKQQGVAGLVEGLKAIKTPKETKPAQPLRNDEHSESSNATPEIAISESVAQPPRNQPIMDTDPGGVVIPEILAEIFEADGLETYIDDLKTIKKGVLLAASINPRYRLVNTNTFTIDMDNAIRHLKFATPKYVCRFCSGSGKGMKIDEACPCCKSSGWVNQVQYDNTPEELK